MASSIVTSATHQLGTLLVEEAKYLYEVSDRIENLQSELEWMQCFLEDADNRQHQEKVVRKWVAEIRDFAYEAEDLIESYVHEVSHPRRNGILNAVKWFSCICSDALTLHEIGSSMDDLSSKISKLNSRLQTYGIQIIRQPESSSAYNLAMREQRRTYSHIEQVTVGLENHIIELVDELATKNEVKVVGISGIGGLGKTTLARKIYSHKKVKQHFKNRVWVYISTQFDKRNVFEEILKGLSCSESDNDSRKKIKDLTDDELPRKICNILEEEECLVLLDDVWSNDAWDTLKPAFESIKRSGSKILITTRSLELVQHAHPSGYTHPFGVLSEEDGWKLLQQTAFSEENNTAAEEVKAKMEELGKEMLKRCNGLPLAIVALAGILATKKTIHEWETVGKNISSYLSDMIGEGGGDRILPVLELSYYDLPFYLKPCFMYLGCFPEDYEIQADRLYHLWEAEGLVNMPADEQADSHGVRLDDIAESFLNQLVNRSMVQVDKRWVDGSIRSCRLHDIMRDMCLKKCREVNFLKMVVEDGNSEELSNYNIVSSSAMKRKSRRYAIHWKNNYHRSLSDAADLNEAPYIRSFLVFTDSYSGERPPSLNVRKFFSLLRVLDLGDLEISRVGLPIIKYCIHLRYLRLRVFQYDRWLDFIWGCKYLETLDLRNGYSCPVNLSNGVWKLGRLRNLYLPEFVRLKDSSKLRLTPVQLRQIDTFVNFDVDLCEMEDLQKMTNLRIFSFTERSKIENKDYFEHLVKSPAIKTGRLKNPLNLAIRARVINEDPTILTSSSLKLIFIYHLCISGRFEDVPFGQLDIQTFACTLMKLTLEDSEIASEGILEVEKLPCLQELALHGHAIKDCKMSFSEGGFKQLLRLRLRYMEELKEWEVGEGALPNLLSLKIFGCDELKRIPEGLPTSMKIHCSAPSYINGMEKYKQGRD